MTVDLAVCRWQCQAPACPRRTFSDQIASIARPFARRTARGGEIVSLVGHATGGRPAERLLHRLGLGISDDTINVDLERRVVIDVLEDRDVVTCTNWLKRHPEVDVISRDRCGLYAQSARQGAPHCSN